MLKKVKCRCKYCGLVAYGMRNIKDARKILKKDKRFTCNSCMIKYFGFNDMWQPTLLKPKINY